MYRIGTIAVAIVAVCFAGAAWAEDEAACPARDFDHCVALGKTWPECGVCLDTKGKTLPPRPTHDDVRIFRQDGPRPWFPIGLWVPTPADLYLAERMRR